VKSKLIILTILILICAMADRAHSQWFDVVSFREDNTWYEPYDADVDTVWAYPGDSLNIPLFLYYEHFCSEMYSFSATISLGAGCFLVGISLENTMFEDNYEELAIFDYNPDFNEYVTFVSDTLFNPPYEADTSVKISYWFELKARIDIDSTQCTLGILNCILADSTGYVVNLDDVTLRIIIKNLPYERGDIDNDSAITFNDLELLTDYVYRGQETINPLGLGDINRDGKIDILDILALREIIINP